MAAELIYRLINLTRPDSGLSSVGLALFGVLQFATVGATVNGNADEQLCSIWATNGEVRLYVSVIRMYITSQGTRARRRLLVALISISHV